ncbi:sensor histidine kinase [Paenibacillus sp. J2TS4]|uniref:sensor histidine kinase n=1 Tax=Paenibacillus sp. J2TS4 TaxID=2807194 RepID=UPI001B218521|nr:sensor histidine kinase [Paenibacillus sp. J2TS4]GIP34803.1 histidine kinase [Paenibacillus sp. J2TS4]
MKLLNWFANRWVESLQLRLTIYFLLILVPLVFVSLFANFESRSILEQQVSERIQNAMVGAMEYIDLTVQNVEELSMIIAMDSNINQKLTQVEAKTRHESNYDFSQVLSSISNISSINPLLSQISILHASSGTVLSTKFGGKRIDNIKNQPWYMEIQSTNKGAGIWLIPRQDQPGYDIELQSIFSPTSITLMRLMDYFNPDVSNVVMITINKQKLLQMISNLSNSKEEKVYLFNENQQLVAATTDEPMPAMMEDYQNIQGSTIQTAMDSQHELIVTRIHSKETGWSVVLVQPVQTIHAPSNNLRKFTYYIIAVSILLTVIIAWVVYRGISSPLASLAYGMKQMRQGNLNTRLPIDRRDDFGNVTRSFNDMVKEHRHLIKNNYEQQLLMAKTELRLLQSQINPHFLYNTLDSIYWKAENYEAGEISEMVLNLSKFFRTSLSKGKDVFTIQETMEHLNYYLTVQRLRYADHFVVKFDVEESCNHVPLLKLILQPLVENAILHGLEKKSEGGELLISCKVQDETLILKVEDNGKGIESNRLHAIRQELAKVSYNDYKGFSGIQPVYHEFFGLRNVKARLKLFYKEQADLTIDSTLNFGTVITISIPLQSCYELETGQEED